AERQLSELVKGLDPKRFQVHVVTFYDGGGLRPEIEGLDHVKVHSLRKKSRWHILRPLIRLFAIVRSVRPEVLHGYMGNANELCLVLGALFRRRVVWGLRMSDRDLKFYDWLTRFTLHTGAWLSKFPDLIIVNSFAGRRDHKACGFKSKEMY
ncbi:MAG: glycosyltransferase, partial [Verrucomicrobiota bacterium]